MPPDDPDTRVALTVPKLAGTLARLDPGGLARLRQMDVAGPGEMIFWQMAADLALPGRREGWMLPTKLMAQLTPKGDPRAGKRSAHDSGHPVGRALAKAGFSDMRLLRTIERANHDRAAAIAALVRFVATRSVGEPIDCVELYWLLNGTGPDALRRLADQYYREKATAPEGTAP